MENKTCTGMLDIIKSLEHREVKQLRPTDVYQEACLKWLAEAVDNHKFRILGFRRLSAGDLFLSICANPAKGVILADQYDADSIFSPRIIVERVVRMKCILTDTGENRLPRTGEWYKAYDGCFRLCTGSAVTPKRIYKYEEVEV